tara:strand:+ start:205 stop:1419 length:1215 start_codon:yes stop_codon:yes gene_type:complete
MQKKPITKSKIFRILENISSFKLKSETISLIYSKDRILSSNIKSKINLPPFNNSAVDGYAIRSDNLSNTKKFKCTYRITAGENKKIFLKKNEIARIFTGAIMPKNSKTIVMQENVLLLRDKIILKKIPKKGENCRIAGEDIAKGSVVLKKGDIINSKNLNLLAAIGKTKIKVLKKIKVGYFTSGNELRKPSEKINNSEINNSNQYSLKTLLDNEYIYSKNLGILKDSKKNIIHSLNKNINKYNVIITAGGASVGEEDHLVSALIEKGQVFFWKCAIKPGRPLAIGKIKNTIIICLPGNPVSVHLLFGMIIKPFLFFLCSAKMIKPQPIKAKVNFSMKKKTQRLEWLRVKIIKSKEIIVDKYPKQGSGMISSIAFSDGIVEIPENVKIINKGDKFDFYPFQEIFS